MSTEALPPPSPPPADAAAPPPPPAPAPAESPPPAAPPPSKARDAYFDIRSIIAQGIAEVDAEKAEAAGAATEAPTPAGEPAPSLPLPPPPSDEPPPIKLPPGFEVPEREPDAPDAQASSDQWTVYKLQRDLEAKAQELEGLKSQLSESMNQFERHKKLLREDPIKAAEEAGTPWEELVKNALESPETMKIKTLVQEQEKALSELKAQQENQKSEFEKFQKKQQYTQYVRSTLQQHKDRWPLLFAHEHGEEALCIELTDRAEKGQQVSFESAAERLEEHLWNDDLIKKAAPYRRQRLPAEEAIEKALAMPVRETALDKLTPREAPSSNAPTAPASKPLPGNGNASATDPGPTTLGDWDVFKAKNKGMPEDSGSYAQYIVEKYPPKRL